VIRRIVLFGMCNDLLILPVELDDDIQRDVALRISAAIAKKWMEFGDSQVLETVLWLTDRQRTWT
jgi:hypothetical protein